jgi:molybdate/tungstate transport system ATP-binding protein
MICVEKLSMTQGTFSLRDVSFEVHEGQYAVLTGKSGSGKTSILEAICGLRRIQAGRVLLGDVDVTHLRPAERRIGYVPQDGALFPNYRVGEQLAFALIVRRHAHQAINERVKDLAEMLKITHLLDRFPDNLSGGEIQRVALGRTLALEPRVLCFDEPLCALDSDTHEEICELLHTTIKAQQITTLHITHNRAEASILADIAFDLRDGCISRIDGQDKRP